MARQIPRVSGVDKRLIPILEAIKENIEELAGSGPKRALRYGDFRSGTFLTAKGQLGISPDIVIPTVAPLIERRINELQAVQTDASTLAEELLGVARYGVIIGEKAGESKTLKVNVNGHIAGYGFAVYGGEAGPITSEFIIQADRFAVVFPNPPWTASTAFSLGQYVCATDVAGVGNVIFECTTAGSTGSSEPTWDDTPGNTTNDGTVVWTARTIDERVPFVVGNINGSPGVGINGDLVVDGTIIARHIAAESITADKLAASLVYAGAIVISSGGHIRSGQTGFDTGTGWFIGNVSGVPRFSIGNPAGNKVTWDGSTLTVIGSVSGALDAGSLVGDPPAGFFDDVEFGWTMTNVFSSTDADTVSWGSGTFTTAGGTNYSIGAGNTGNMTARTFIYLDPAVSTTAFQVTTTAANAVGAGKFLVAVAENVAGQSAFFQVFGGYGGTLVTANQIAANAIVANAIAAGAVTAAKLAASLVYAGAIVIDTAGHIRSGQTGFDTGTGWFLGNSGGTPVLSIGNPAGNSMTWDGTTLTVVGVGTSGSFSGNVTGMTAATTLPLSWKKSLNKVELWTTQSGSHKLGTSNSGAMTIDNLPAEITPSSDQFGMCTGLIDDAGGSDQLFGAYRVLTTGVIEFYLIWHNPSLDRVTTVAFTASGLKGFYGGTNAPKMQITYSI
jgi:hypothetical protein